MSAEWKQVKLDDVCAADKRQGMHVGLPYIGLEDIESHTGRFIGSHTPRAAKSSTFRFSPEHVLYGRLRPYLNKVCAPGFAGHCSTEIIPLKPKPGLSREFLVYWFLRQETVARIDASTTGARMPRASLDDVLELPLAAPPLAEQQRIVGILDEAFEGIAAARANAEQNLRNARALFESRLESVFSQHHGWSRRRLGDLSAIQYGYTESASSEPVGPKFLRITDIRDNDVDWSKVPFCPIEPAECIKYRLAEGDIVFARTGATTGNSFLVSDPPEAIFASYLIRVRLNAYAPLPEFVNLFFQTRAYWDAVRTGITGSAQGGFNASKLAELVIPSPESHDEQEAIVRGSVALSDAVQQLANVYEQKLAALDELKQSLLHYAFTGQLTASRPRPARPAGLTSPLDRHAGILAIAHRLHVRHGREHTFGRVKAEKVAHLVESHLGLDLGRTPVKEAAGPYDRRQRTLVQRHAREASYFVFEGTRDTSYHLRELANFDALVERTRTALGDRYADVEHLVGLMVPMRTLHAEVFATTYAAWNNLLLDGRPATDDAIVREAREDWHPHKLRIPPEHFLKAIAWMRRRGVTPSGTGRRVADLPPSPGPR